MYINLHVCINDFRQVFGEDLDDDDDDGYTSK